MDVDILFGLGLLVFWLFRFLSRRKKTDSAAGNVPGTQQSATLPEPGQVERRPVPISGRSPAQPRPEAAESDFDVALREIRTALGMDSSRQSDPHRPPPEVFGRSEESFERQEPYSEVDFHDRNRDKADSPYEFHSQMEKKPETVKRHASEKARTIEEKDTVPAQSLKRSSIASRLNGRKSLREVAILSEILGPPVSRKKR